MNNEGRQDWADRLSTCNERLPLVCTNCGHHKMAHTRCKLRWCPVCAKKLSHVRVMRFTKSASRMQWPLAVTLTIRNLKCARAAVHNIGRAFTKFRRCRFWKDRVKGGVVSFEITNRGKGWHPHLHILCDCRWLAASTPEPTRKDSKETVRHKLRSAQRELSSTWAKCVNQPAAVVWVNRAWGKALKEVLKYNVKPADLIACRDHLGPLFDAMKGRRLITPFGSLYGLSKEWKAEEKSNNGGCECEECHRRGTTIPEAFAVRKW